MRHVDAIAGLPRSLPGPLTTHALRDGSPGTAGRPSPP